MAKSKGLGRNITGSLVISVSGKETIKVTGEIDPDTFLALVGDFGGRLNDALRMSRVGHRDFDGKGK